MVLGAELILKPYLKLRVDFGMRNDVWPATGLRERIDSVIGVIPMLRIIVLLLRGSCPVPEVCPCCWVLSYGTRRLLLGSCPSARNLLLGSVPL